MNTLSSNLFFLLIILGFSSSIQTQTITSDHLFLIQEKGKFGYINNKGEVVIPTIYKDAGQFKEGLAPVAVDGYIGFIDTNNNLVIPAQYDFAESFSEGCALVYQNGKPYFINQDGSHIFDINEQFSDLITDEKEDHPFFDTKIQCGNFKNGYAIIKKNRKTVALLNIDGTLWGGKIFKEINLPFLEGIVKVRDENGFGIMDIEGKIIVPFGKYSQIQAVKNGMVSISKIYENEKDNITGFLDKSGKEIVMIPTGDSLYFDDNFPSDGMIIGKIYRKSNTKNKNSQTKKIPIYYDIKRRKVIRNEEVTSIDTPFQNGHTFVKTVRGHRIMDKKGNLIGDKIFSSRHPRLGFYDGVALVRIGNRNYRLINTKGEFVSNNRWTWFSEKGFKNGVAFVGIGNEKVGTINTKGEWLIKPIKNFQEDVKKLGNWYYRVGHQYVLGINSKTGENWVKHCLYANQNGFQNGLIWIMEKNGMAYIDINGKYIWQQSFPTSSASTMDTLDVFHQRQAQICVQPSNKKIIGFSSESPFPRAKKVPWFHDFQDNQISITLKDAPKDTIKGNFATKRYYITNLTQDTFNFATDTGRLYAKLQALNKSGEWEDIEALQNSGCGNAYYQFPLYPNEYWTGLIPLYKGGFKTQLRLAVFQFRKYGEPFENEIYMYSPPFKGSINPAQFWRKQANNLNKNIDIAVNYRRLGF